MGSCCSAISRPLTIDPDAEHVDWEWLKQNAETGDILLFSTKCLASLIIEWGESTDWSHVGMIVRHRFYANKIDPEKDKLYVWEAEPGSDGNKDALKGDQHQSGVRLVPLQRRIRYTPGCSGMLYKRLNGITESRKQEINKKMLNWEQSEDGKPFTSQFLTMVKAVTTNSEDLNESYSSAYTPSAYFCSQLVARTYIHLGLLPPSKFRPAEFAPVDFGDLYDSQRGKLFLGMRMCRCGLEDGNPLNVVRKR